MYLGGHCDCYEDTVLVVGLFFKGTPKTFSIQCHYVGPQYYDNCRCKKFGSIYDMNSKIDRELFMLTVVAVVMSTLCPSTKQTLIRSTLCF